MPLRCASSSLADRTITNTIMIRNITLFFIAAFFEILGCFAFWLYFRDYKTHWWLALGVIALLIFAYTLTKIDISHAGRIYAIYGGIYIISSLAWLALVEKESFNIWDILGSFLALLGAFVIFFGNSK